MSLLDDVLRDFDKGISEARAARPDVPLDDWLVPVLSGTDQPATTFEEINASDEAMLFVCVRCEEGDSNVDGSTRKICDYCRAEVWMSPATLLSYCRVKKTKVACIQCATKQIPASDSASNSQPRS